MEATKEKVLPNRKRKRKRASKGRTLRVSDAVWNYLEKRRTNGARNLSWDRFLRRVLGLPDRSGSEQPLVEGWLEVATGRFYLRKDEANGAAVVAAAKAGRKVPIKPIRLREVRW